MAAIETLSPFEIGQIVKKSSIKFNGNIKLGNTVGTISKLYSDEMFTVEVLKGITLNIYGSCRGYCHGCKNDCYVKKSYRYPSVKISHARTTIVMRQASRELFERWDAQLTRREKSKRFNANKFNGIRINQSGEIESVNEVKDYGTLASNHPDFKFWLYTKAYDIVIPNLHTMPENLYTNISIWGCCGIDEYLSVAHMANVHAFVYVDSVYTVEWYAAHGIIIETFCHAYDSNGKLDHDITCDKCRKCIDSKFKVIGCYGH